MMLTVEFVNLLQVFYAGHLDMQISMSEDVGAGYLARVEATTLGVRPGPGVLFIRMARDLPAEGRPTNMFIELTPGEAVSLVQHIKDCIGIALAIGD